MVLKKMAVVLWIALTLLSGCKDPGKEGPLRVALQYGLAYAPLEIMAQQAAEEGLDIEWVQVNNSAALREGMLTGGVDLGFMGIPPFLIGVDKEMDWMLFTGLNRSYMALNTTEDISGIGQIAPHHRIGLPQPGSIQHILLTMAARRDLGEAGRFDDQLLSLSHPEGMLALAEDPTVQFHFTTMPYVLFEQRDLSARAILTGEEAFGGPFTLIAGVATGELVRKEPDKLKAFQKALEETMAFMAEHPDQAAKLLAKSYEVPEETLYRWLVEESTLYESQLIGLEGFIDHMLVTGLIEGPAAKYHEAVFSD